MKRWGKRTRQKPRGKKRARYPGVTHAVQNIIHIDKTKWGKEVGGEKKKLMQVGDATGSFARGRRQPTGVGIVNGGESAIFSAQV